MDNMKVMKIKMGPWLLWFLLFVTITIDMSLVWTHETVIASCSEEEFACENGRCIRGSYQCDGEDDCSDKSDEQNCPHCKNGLFQCGDGECVSKRLLCDLYDDCQDGSDENNCTNHTCGASQFRCQSGECISNSSRCDGDDTDCFDKSDEANCTECSYDEDSSFARPFKCRTGSRCISEHQLCNLRVDCPDGSDEDEISCRDNTCSEGKFRCDNGRCISERYQCDEDNDCGDNSDEANCTECSHSRFRCVTVPMCVAKSKLCDSEVDCPDGSDERSELCESKECDEYENFRCKSGQCIDNYQNENDSLCDGVKDCKDGSDEANCNACFSKGFTCDKGGCVSKSVICNSQRDCPDGSDENEINCPDGIIPQLMTTFWRTEYISRDQNVSLEYSDESVAVYFEDNVNKSITWPFPLLSSAWEYAQETYGPLVEPSKSPLLYVILGKNKRSHCHIVSSTEKESGFRNVIDCGLRARNGWTTGTPPIIEELLSGLGQIIKHDAEGNENYADFQICGLSMNYAIFYDIYAHLKGAATPDVAKWREGKESEKSVYGKANCFRDWFLPIYEEYGGTAPFRNFFRIMKSHWPEKTKSYRDSIQNFKQFNLGEFVHFWSGAAGTDLESFAQATFPSWNDVSRKQLEKARINFPNLYKYSARNGANVGGKWPGLGIMAGVFIFLLVVVILAAVGIRRNMPYLTQKYSRFTNR